MSALKKTVFFVIIALVSSLFFNSCKTGTALPGVRNELVAVMDEALPGYFMLGDESYGYQYDLLKAYAADKGLELRIVEGEKPSVNAQMLERGEVDLLTTLAGHITEANRAAEVPIYNTSFVLLGSRRKAAEVRADRNFQLIPFLRERKLLVSSGFKGSGVYHSLLDSLPANIYVSARNTFELIEQVARGSYDFLICERSEAQLGCALIRSVEQIYSFDEPVELSVLVTPLDPALKDDFSAWLTGYRNSPEYALLNDLYFERGIVGQVLNRGLNDMPAGRISPFDNMFKRVCGKEGYDWRFISAIAYNESRFNPYVVSERGARGLMQVMPGVVGQFGDPGNLTDPENNVLLALKVLGKIEKSLGFPAGTPQTDRMQITLACYNAGIGHVKDARALARKNGANPNRWADVSHYLTLKSNPAVAQDEVVKCGVFNGSETLAFVNNVVSRYNSYCSRVQR